MKRTAKLTTIFSMTVLLASLAGCNSKSGAEVKGDQLTAVVLANGVSADVTVEAQADGTLYASEVKINNENENDGDDVECEDGVTPDGQPCDDQEDEDKAEDGETENDTDDIECEDGVTPDGQVCEDGQDEAEEDGASENDTDDIECEDGVTPDGQVCEDGPDEAEEDGENDEMDEEEDDSENELVAMVESIADDMSSFTVLGGLTIVLDDAEEDGEADADDEADEADEAELDIATLTVGTWIEVSGEYSDKDAVFYADELKTPDEEVIELDGVISDLTETSFSMFGLTISYDDNTSVLGEDNDEDEADQDEENDGIDCEQEGEHEGDNEGC